MVRICLVLFFMQLMVRFLSKTHANKQAANFFLLIPV